jgi:hypothetical protein
MNKHLTPKAFGVPSLETARRVDDHDKCSARRPFATMRGLWSWSSNSRPRRLNCAPRI